MRSVFFGVFQSFVVLLYILDNETNFVVQVSVFIGVLIDLWKITKVMDVRVRPGRHAVSGAARAVRGSVAQLDPGAGPRGIPSKCLAPRTKGIFSPGDFSGHTWDRGTGNGGEGQGLVLACGARASMATDHGAHLIHSWTGSTGWQESSPAYPSRTSPRISSPRPKCMTM